jgi:hypothetical protein
MIYHGVQEKKYMALAMKENKNIVMAEASENISFGTPR